MSKKDQQDVLKAIFNVKNFAKNLKVRIRVTKKNANTLQEVDFEGGDFLEITSSPSLVVNNKQLYFNRNCSFNE